jgi:hypothetical protein
MLSPFAYHIQSYRAVCRRLPRPNEVVVLPVENEMNTTVERAPATIVSARVSCSVLVGLELVESLCSDLVQSDEACN